MPQNSHINRVIQLIEQDEFRVKALSCVQELKQPADHSYYLAAGFVRNMIWDALHQKEEPTPLNDVDVIYFDDKETDSNTQKTLEQQLNSMMPEVNWQVRNQAKMHIKNGDAPYLNVIDAMGYWPEKETAVAIRKTLFDQYECISAFGFETLFELKVTHNPRRSLEVFNSRAASKKWLIQWSNLRVMKE